MINENQSVETHYTVTNLGETILSALQNMGKDPNSLTHSDLAPVDEFHIRGRESTQELAQLARLAPNTSVLDVGSGLGGSARYLAAEYGARVTGLDLTEEYCQVANMLSRRTGMGDQTEFRQGSALEIPFPDQSFDVAWTEHVQMNIEDKEGFYSEMGRVIRPGGKLVFHDIFRGSVGELHFPVPWAGDPSISFLATPQEIQQLLASLGFHIQHWEDKTAASLEFFSQVVARIHSQGPPSVGIHLLMGDDYLSKFENIRNNLSESRACVIQAVAEKGVS